MDITSTTLWATLDRPEAMNSVNFEVMAELEKIMDRIENEDGIRTFVFSGGGSKMFVSGGDLKEFHQLRTADEAGQMSRRMHAILERIETAPCWTIACINGDAYGGGCEMMLAFDFRMASSEASFGFTQGRFYLPPGWGGLTRLVEQVGRSTALRWLAETAVIDADTALTQKLIDRMAKQDELREKVLEWAAVLGKNDRDYIDVLKQGARRLGEARRKAIAAELKPFCRFWEDERHHRRVQEFLNRKE